MSVQDEPGFTSQSSGPQDPGTRLEGADLEQPWAPPGVDDGLSNEEVLNPGEPLPEPGASTPLEEHEPEGIIPPSPLWAMKDRRHVQWSKLVRHPPERIREAFVEGDDTVYVINDGHQHVMLGRRVGTVSDGAQYALVGRAPKSVYEGLRSYRVFPSAAFDDAEEIALCAIDIDEADKASNIFTVQVYGTVSAVPTDYLPGHPLITFSEPLPLEEG